MDKFCEFDREILSMPPSCFIITKKYMAQRHNKLNKTTVLVLVGNKNTNFLYTFTQDTEFYYT